MVQVKQVCPDCHGWGMNKIGTKCKTCGGKGLLNVDLEIP